MRRTLGCAVILLCSLSWAQSGPSIAPFPLNMRRVPAGFTAKNEEALAAEVRKAIRDTGATVPNVYKTEQAIAELKRQDCDLENACLSTFALKAGMLYALYVSVDLSIQGVLVVSGRVVRSDGVLVEAQKSVSRTVGKDAFAVVAKDLLTKLLRDELKLSALPVAKPVAVVKPVEVASVVADAGVSTPVPSVDAGVLLPPPPPPLEEGHLKTVGFVSVGVGGAAAATGAILYAVGSGAARTIQSGAIVPKGNETPEEAGKSYRQALTLQPAGVALLGVGAAIAAVGVVFVVMSPSTGPRVSMTPLPGGGAFVGLEGELP